MLENLQIIQHRYRLETKLGDRVSRQTWLAEDILTGDRVVVKLLAFGSQVEWQSLTLFEREAQILKQLNCPFIPQYRDFFSIDNRALWFCLVEDYIEGISLDRAISNHHKFTEAQIRNIAIETLEILCYLHNFTPPILHRDIKPSNLILGKDDRIYLVDFGAVQDRTPIEGVTFTVAGTYGYTPMEQFGGRAVPASDLYALGATIVHLLTGVPPADLPQSKLRIQFRERVEIERGFLVWLERVIAPCPEDRYPTAREALDCLRSPNLLISQPASQPTYSSVKIENDRPHKLLIYLPLDGEHNSILETIAYASAGALSLVTIAMILCLVMTAIIYLSLSSIDALVIVGLVATFFCCCPFMLPNKYTTGAREAIGRNRKYCLIRIDRREFSIQNHDRRRRQETEFIGSTNRIEAIEIEENWRAEAPKHRTLAIVTPDKTYILPATMTAAECAWLKYEIEAWLLG
jgi:serine/threonine protein kinase